MTLGGSSSLKLIGKRAFYRSGVRVIHIPHSVEKLCESCFYGCKSLSRVTFGECSSLKVIGNVAFRLTGLRSFCLPEHVTSIGGSTFSDCPLKDFVICDGNVFFQVFDGLVLSRNQRECYSCTGVLEEVVVPDGVEELREKCFSGCKSLSSVTFGESSSLKLIGERAFSRSGVVEIHIPDGVEELCDMCFYGCKSLSRVAFGGSSSLKLIGDWAFSRTRVVEIHIPDGI